jgi:AraC-like DNA-binding protein
MTGGVLIVRASGAGAAQAALEATGSRPVIDSLQLIVEGVLPRQLRATPLTEFPGCAVEIRPANETDTESSAQRCVMLITIATSRLSIDPIELQPLMFQPVQVAHQLVALFGSSIGQLLTVAMRSDILEQHGIGHYLVGLAELLLRSALRSHLNRPGSASRYREAIDYIKRHLTDTDLTAERIADTLFISRRRLYQLFDDQEGIAGRIRRLRIERAQELLADPAHRRCGIAELARQCGFVSPTHFSRTFRKVTGHTPSEYRDRSLARSNQDDDSVGEVDGGDQAPEHP